MKGFFRSAFRQYISVALICFFLVFSMSSTIYEWNNKGKVKPVRYFELVHNFPTDYNFYLSRIRQGKEGAWLATEKYTSEPHAASLSQVLYVLIGRVSDWAHIQTPYIWISYHAMRVFFGFVFLYTVWKVSGWVFPRLPWQIFSFLMIVTASTWPKFETVDGYPRFGGYMPWWSVIDSLQRITFMPHVLLGQTLMVFMLWVFAGGFITKKNPMNWVFLGVIGIIEGIVFPPSLVFIYGTLALASAGDIVAGIVDGELTVKKWAKFISRVIVDKWAGRLIVGVMTFPTAIYYGILFTRYPWKRLVEFDVLHPTKYSFTEYFMALGATLVMGCIGIGVFFFLRKKDPVAKKLGMFAVWVMSWLIFLAVFSQIPQQSPTRFTQMVPYVPLGLFSTYLVYVVYHWWRKRIPKGQGTDSAIPYAVFIIPFIVMLLGLGSMASSYLWLRDFIDHKLRADIPLVPRGAEVMYPLNDLIETFVWLQVYSDRREVVMSGVSTGNLIPVYSGNTTLIGHANTVNAEAKEAAVHNVYRGAVPKEEALGFLRDARISYIIYGPEEYQINGYKNRDLKEIYPELIEVYKNNFVTLYKFPQDLTR